MIVLMRRSWPVSDSRVVGIDSVITQAEGFLAEEMAGEVVIVIVVKSPNI